MKKVSKASWLVLAGGVLVITLASLGMVRSQQDNDLKNTKEELSQARQKLGAIRIDTLTGQKNGLSAQLTQLNDQLTASQSKMSLSTDSISASNTLLDTAQSCGVTIREINSSGWSTGNLATIDNSGLPITIIVSGNVSNIVNFVIALSRAFPAGLVNMVQLQVSQVQTTPTPSSSPTPTPTPTPSTVPAPGTTVTPVPDGQPTATIELTIYRSRGN